MGYPAGSPLDAVRGEIASDKIYYNGNQLSGW